MANFTIETGVAALEFARRVTLGLLEGIPADQRCHQPMAGSNHVLWVLGHVANNDDFWVANLTNSEPTLPARWRTLFAPGSTPTAIPDDYPPYENVLEELNGRRVALLKWYRSLDEDKMSLPLPEDLKRFAPSYAALASTLAWHEGLHAGQLTAIRKSLGLAPKFG